MSLSNPNIDNDRFLLQQVEQGDAPAFNALFEKYWQKAYSDAFKRLKNHDDSRDIVQDIFTHIWLNRATLHIECLPAYLNIAVRNKVLKLLSKKKNAHSFFEFYKYIPKESLRADSDLLWKEFMDSYEALIQQLPPKRQEIFRLRYHADKSTKEIAKQLGVTPKTVQNQLGKAIDTLKVSLSRILSVVIILLKLLF